MPEEKKPEEQAARLKQLFTHFSPDTSIRVIASHLEVDFSYLAKVLRGDLPPSETLLSSIARYFFLSEEDLEKYLQNEIDLKTLESRSYSWKLDCINFSKPDCSAWQAVIRFAEDSSWLEKNLHIFTQNICVFLLLAGFYREDPAYLSYLQDRFFFSPEGLNNWLSSLKDPQMRRLVFHAFLFTVNPIEYAREGGLLQLDRAIHFQEPDRHIRTPEFAFELIKKCLPPEA